MSKFFKRITSLLLSATIVICFAVSSFAEDADVSDKTANGYPNVFVAGMFGWSEEDSLYEKTPYWGLLSEEGELMNALEDRGYDCTAVSPGGISSAWDRACELYAQIAGTVVDYGEAHSEKYNHSRYGKSYVGKAAVENFGETKINLFGHSFGGNTIRLFTYIMEKGCQEEVEKSGENVSPFFTGGKGNLINSVTTLSAPLNGTMVADVLYNMKLPVYAMGFAANLMGMQNNPFYDFKLCQFGLSGDNGEKVSLSLKNIKNFSSQIDNCGYDMTMGGAKELNDEISDIDGVYYFSYSACGTEQKGKYQNPTDVVGKSYMLSSWMIGHSLGFTFGGTKITDEWLANDGIVPVKSALYPENSKHTDYTESTETFETGVWYVMPTITGNHSTLMNAGKSNLDDMFAEQIDRVNSLK